jgi:hypothetical protein
VTAVVELEAAGRAVVDGASVSTVVTSSNSMVVGVTVVSAGSSNRSHALSVTEVSRTIDAAIARLRRR